MTHKGNVAMDMNQWHMEKMSDENYNKAAHDDKVIQAPLTSIYAKAKWPHRLVTIKLALEPTPSVYVFDIRHHNMEAVRSTAENLKTQMIISLPDDGYKLTKPLPVTIEFYDNEVLASLQEYELCSEAKTSFEAVHDLKLQILDLYDELSETPDEELGDEMLAWKKAC